jgi:hypothetical protein
VSTAWLLLGLPSEDVEPSALLLFKLKLPEISLVNSPVSPKFKVSARDEPIGF